MNNIVLKKSIPNFITLSNLFLGFTSIVLLSLSINSTIEYIKIACYLILFSTILDVLDGKIARKLDISNDFGKEIDSLADLVSFCIVPSFLIFVYYTVVLPDYIQLSVLILLSSFPLIFGAVRLAKFNSLKEMRNSDKYLGLPTPSNAILICSLILFTMNSPKGIIRGFIGTNKFETIVYNMFGWIINIEFMIMLISIISSLLLMSKINYEKFPLISFNVNKQNNNNLIKMILFLIVFILSIYYGYYDIILLLFISIYIFGNALKFLFNYNK